MTPTVGLIISAILAALNEAPKAIELAVAAKNYIKALVGAGVITSDLQDRLNAQVRPRGSRLEWSHSARLGR